MGPVEQLKMPVKEENLPLPKVARKSSVTSPRNPKVGRQNSRSKSAKAPSLSEGTSMKKKRSSSSAKQKGGSSGSSMTPRPSSKTSGSRGGSRNGSRASSPRCLGKIEPRASKLGLTKKALQKSSWKSMEMEKAAASTNASLDPISTGGVKKTKRKKKRTVPSTTS